MTTADASRIEIDASELDNSRRSRVLSRNLQRRFVAAWGKVMNLDRFDRG